VREERLDPLLADCEPNQWLELFSAERHDSSALPRSKKARYIGKVWSERYDELVAYHTEHGSFPPQRSSHSSPGGLGLWVKNQRRSSATMPQKRKKLLEALEWRVWSVRGSGE
jgi:hypothetical protein